MEELIKQAFLHVEVLGPLVQQGHFDLIGPDGEIILPAVWDKVIQPDSAITMHMWPMDQRPKPPQPGGSPPGMAARPHGHHAHPGARPASSGGGGVPPQGMRRPPGPPPPPGWHPSMPGQMPGMGGPPRPPMPPGMMPRGTGPNIVNVSPGPGAGLVEVMPSRKKKTKPAPAPSFLGALLGGSKPVKSSKK